MSRVYVSIGSNIDRENNLRRAVACLQERYGPLLLSSVYESRAVGFEGDNFYNQVAGFDTDESPATVAGALRAMEGRLGRNRGGDRYSPRTVDLDLLLYDDLATQTDTFTVPRPEINDHAFVLGPLAEIAGQRRHPVSGRRFCDLWEAFDEPEQRIWPVSFSPRRSG